MNLRINLGRKTHRHDALIDYRQVITGGWTAFGRLCRRTANEQPLFSRFLARLAAGVCVVAHVASCDLVVPPDPPLPTPDIQPDDFVWGDLEVNREYHFIDVARIDCSLVVSTLTAHGKCVPVKIPMGSALSCPLAHPGSTMYVSCLPADDVPAVYAKIAWANDVGELDFSKAFGSCRYEMAGPAAGYAPRYDTDEGYKVCLFADIAPYSRLLGQENALRPGGLYVDFSHSPFVPDEKTTECSYPVFSNPDALVLDARLLDLEERKAALNDLFKLFEFYSSIDN